MYALDSCVLSSNEEDPETIFVLGNCVITGKEYEVTTSKKCIMDYISGANLQDAFPNLSDDDREFLKTGISPEGWNQIFGEDNE